MFWAAIFLGIIAAGDASMHLKSTFYTNEGKPVALSKLSLEDEILAWDMTERDFVHTAVMGMAYKEWPMTMYRVDTLKGDKVMMTGQHQLFTVPCEQWKRGCKDMNIQTRTVEHLKGHAKDVCLLAKKSKNDCKLVSLKSIHPSSAGAAYDIRTEFGTMIVSKSRLVVGCYELNETHLIEESERVYYTEKNEKMGVKRVKN